MSAPAGDAVTATLTRALRGTDLFETFTVLRGELGAAHLAGVPVLPDRGPQAELAARTSAVLDSLHADRQPHGWRITSVPGADSRQARALLASDLNVVADVLGAESGSDTGPVAFSLLGPVSLAATVHVHNGEKLQSDPGARRDLTQSWCAGLGELLAALRRNTDGRGTVLVVEEPELDRVLRGTIPTASGYRTLRSLPRHEVRAALTEAVGAARDAGAERVLLAAGSAEPSWALRTGADTAVTALPTGPTEAWEPLAALHEAGVGLCFDTAPVTGRPAVRAHVERVLRPWTELGMDPAALLGTLLAPSSAVSELTPPELPGALRRVTELGDALTEACSEA
ncbi:hypothetical protein [Kocuria varians]|uniref:Cobalamin-independent methionine synthase MetE C-terminal/archaeal domain-containing protein n=1 Tax=Kocuria varians TaxID=1272 RepID=A0A7D7L0U8_KOCVA|nr:hypothetical protein [Kocuria varians]QMS57531.1 hypothetical protein CIB50_0002277 [Kocuria varians]